MPFSSRSYVNRYIPSNRFPLGLKWLLIANIAIFVFGYILRASHVDLPFLLNFALVPSLVVRHLEVWRVVTYMFFHSGIFDILWNMLALWLFGIELERLWGTAKFLKFYFLCGIFAALTVIACAYIFHAPDAIAIGSSGAVYGVLMAYGVMFPDQSVLFSFIIPMKSKYFVMIIGAIVFLQSYMATVGSQGAGVAAVGELGGFVAGYLLLRGRKLRGNVRDLSVASYKDWKLRRAKKKFEVYLRKQDSNRDRWVH